MYEALKITIDPTAIAAPGNTLEQALLTALENRLDDLAEASAAKINSGDLTTENIQEALVIMELTAFRASVRAAVTAGNVRTDR